MVDYFNIKYELSSSITLDRINKQIIGRADYVCVVDGNVLQMVHKDKSYRELVNGGMFSICDSSWVPLFLRLLYRIRVPQYCGSDIFKDIISMKKYRMMFLGTSSTVLQPLKQRLAEQYDEKISDMQFVELPFCDVNEFDYNGIAEMVNDDNPDIIWISLGAPKQEIFMSRLNPLLDRGVMIAVGAVFKFFSGVGEKRAPKWMIRCHIEFLYRLFFDPFKQISRCMKILYCLPAILIEELRKKQLCKV